MGRKSKAALAAEKVSAQKPKSTNTGLERVETEPGTTNPPLEKTEIQAEISPMAAKAISKKTPGKNIGPAIVRRSQRLISTPLPCRNEDIERVIEEITASESDKEDEDEQHMHQEKELKFKTTKSTFLFETSSYAEGKYRGLYIDSRKKIEALTEDNRQLALKLDIALDKLEGFKASTKENHDLALKLENSLGKVEVYEKVLEMAKEVLLVARATETAPNVCTEPINGALTEIRSSKRTRRNQESGKN
ncbi:hypothetical protein HS088_TW17G00295 [Tripterygium wilfordii]|uniref:Uncharacterized protein n=1 Tax=Tripterygium wilfordii TaxID=458696 RepID=A0A7J7CFP3_TRIWF|nr:uncharacterized protein LOC119982201 isoform X2 [Tripterygium wilfordii]KAF5732765.1 hypothetical protein HS088_TW17G00295 [Tripterygium wilfordii]